MRKNTVKAGRIESSKDQCIGDKKLHQDPDSKILTQIEKRKEENQALKKLLDNLNTISPKVKEKIVNK